MIRKKMIMKELLILYKMIDIEEEAKVKEAKKNLKSQLKKYNM